MRRLTQQVRDLLSRKRQDQIAYESVFKTDLGRRVLDHMIRNGFILKPTLGRDHDETMMNEGTRRFVLSILRKVHRGMEDYTRELERVMQESE